MVTAIVSHDRLEVPAGAVLMVPATWQEYQQLMEQRGDSALPRIKYRHGEVLLMSPMAAHGRDASLLADIAKVLLNYEEREYDAFTPVTMELPEASGIEPDYCFYIDNWQAVSGKQRINWQQDPPPDLVIEVDVTSYSNVADYVPYQVPEIWLWKKQLLKIYQWRDGEYVVSDRSFLFPAINLPLILESVVKDAYDRNSSFAIRNFQRRLLAGDL
jgi:Uma2 family endonuclease